MNSPAAAYLQPDAIRAGLSRRKMLDKIFVVLGLILMLACLGILAVLFLDLVVDGSSRFGWDFFTNFPSRHAERAGILGAWVGTSLIMLVGIGVSFVFLAMRVIARREYVLEQ
jgi:phosphate transport system permease protein